VRIIASLLACSCAVRAQTLPPPIPVSRPAHAGALPQAAARHEAAPAQLPSLEIAPVPLGPLSNPLPSGFANPLPGGVVGGYPLDTGLDISGYELPVHAIADGAIVYSEPGHTRWTGPRDDDNAVLIELDRPLSFGDRRITHVWYAHLSKLERVQSRAQRRRHRIVAGERLGISGRANGHPHLHLGLLLDGETRQYSGTFLGDSEIRELLGVRVGQRLPK
jgi:murein DD-endopeptidase MepM/ murein hydrolase activator NlpD